MNCLKRKEFYKLQAQRYTESEAETLEEISVLCPDCYDEGPGYCEECRGAGTRWLELPDLEVARLRLGGYEATAGEEKERPETREESEWGRGDYLRDCAKDDPGY